MSKTFVVRYIKWILAIVIILYVSLEIIDYGTKLYYAGKGSQWYPARIERITGIRVPHYDVINHYVSRLCVEEDSVKFYTIPSSDVFDEIDKRIMAGDTCWKKMETCTLFISGGIKSVLLQRAKNTIWVISILD